MTAISRETLLENIRDLFRVSSDRDYQHSRLIGAEIELIPCLHRSGDRVFPGGLDTSSAKILRVLGNRHSWQEEPMGEDPSHWCFADGRMTFEPGGQIEFSSAAFPTANDLLEALDRWLGVLHEEASRCGVELKALGIEDIIPLGRVPLQLQRDRYRTMARYFDSIGPYGAMMMRQTASLQINVERGPRPQERWRLLNALAPFLVALFANSPRYAGVDTSHKSYRANVWRLLDAKRTGIIHDSSRPAEHYLEFALDAPMILGNEGAGFLTFCEVMEAGRATWELWETHLSTLFPEVRPKDYFEIRSIDAIRATYLSAPIALVSGLVYSDDATTSALELLGEPDPGLLVAAGREGLAHPEIRDRAHELVRIGMHGCRALGEGYLSATQLALAETFFDDHTFRGRSPADNG